MKLGKGGKKGDMDAMIPSKKLSTVGNASLIVASHDIDLEIQNNSFFEHR